MISFENFKLISEEIPAGSKILNSEIVNQFDSVFVRVEYEISEEYQKTNDLIYKNRYLYILLVAGANYEGSAILSYANTNR